MRTLMALCLLSGGSLFAGAAKSLPRTVEKTIDGVTYAVAIDTHTMVDKSAIYRFDRDVDLKRLLKDDPFMGEIRLHAVVRRKDMIGARWDVAYTLHRGALGKRLGASRFADIETFTIRRTGMKNPVYVIQDTLDMYPNYSTVRWSLYLSDPDVLIIQDSLEKNTERRTTLQYGDAGRTRTTVSDKGRLKEAVALLEAYKEAVVLFRDLLEPRKNVNVEKVTPPLPSLEHGRRTLQGLLQERKDR